MLVHTALFPPNYRSVQSFTTRQYFYSDMLNPHALQGLRWYESSLVIFKFCFSFLYKGRHPFLTILLKITHKKANIYILKVKLLIFYRVLKKSQRLIKMSFYLKVS